MRWFFFLAGLFFAWLYFLDLFIGASPRPWHKRIGGWGMAISFAGLILTLLADIIAK